VKILATVKRVPDPNATIKVKPDGSGIVTDNLKYVVNPFDEIAIEEALRLKATVAGGEVILVGIGSKPPPSSCARVWPWELIGRFVIAEQGRFARCARILRS
jgi:electron transfer flavoprotein alpha/beta subunit